MWAIRNGLESLGSNFVENGSDYTMLEFFFMGIFGLALAFFFAAKKFPRKAVHDRLCNLKQIRSLCRKTSKPIKHTSPSHITTGY